MTEELDPLWDRDLDAGVRDGLDEFEIASRVGLPGRFDGDYNCWILPEAAIRPLDLADFDAVLGTLAEDENARWQTGTLVIDTDPPDRVYEVEPIDDVVLHTDGTGTLHMLVGMGLPRYIDEEFEAGVDALLAPMMERSGASAQAPVTTDDAFFGTDIFVVKVEFLSISDRTVGELLDVALAAQALMKAARRGSAERALVTDLFRAGHVSALVGQRESVWLEAKSQPWDLASAPGKAEAAKDLSAIANAGGGVVLIPAKTASDRGEDVIVAIGTLPLDMVSEVQLRDTIARRTFPPLREVGIEVLDCGDDRGRVMITVPAHRPEDWPHFVVGDQEAAFPSASVAAYVRSGAKNSALAAPELHRLMRRTSGEA